MEEKEEKKGRAYLQDKCSLSPQCKGQKCPYQRPQDSQPRNRRRRKTLSSSSYQTKLGILLAYNLYP